VKRPIANGKKKIIAALEIRLGQLRHLLLQIVIGKNHRKNDTQS
jgi:hypothetical protein